MLLNFQDLDNISVDTLEEYRMNGLAAYLVSRTKEVFRGVKDYEKSNILFFGNWK